MNILSVTYANGTVELISSDLSPEQFFDSRFGGLDPSIREKCKVEIFQEEQPAKTKAKK